jgi:molecular chaperone DnaK (HSP70)
MCRADDAYCGACGRLCAQLVLAALPSVLVAGQVPPKVALRIANPTCAAARIEEAWGPDWLEVTAAAGVEVPPGGCATLVARAQTLALRQPESAAVRMATSLGEARALVMVIADPPELATSPAALEHWPDGGASRRYELELYPTVGHLRVLAIAPPRAAWLAIDTAGALPAVAGPDSPVRLTAIVHGDRLPVQRGTPANAVKALVGITYDGPHGPAPAAFELSLELRDAPELTWVGEDAPPMQRLQTSGQLVGFTFANALDGDPLAGRRNGRLELTAVELRPPPGAAAPVQRLSPLPVTLAGGESRGIELHVNCEAMAPGIHYFDLDVTTNRPRSTSSFRVPVQVRAVPPFRGVVAIDFGTSNTCCALLPEGGDFELVQLDEQRETAPTVVRYLDLSGAEPLIETGLRVKRLAAVDEKVAGGTVARLKQQLGEATSPLTVKPQAAAEWLMREAREAAADYLRHLRAMAEKRHGTSFHELILTHPAVCSLRQYRNLKWAVEQAFGSGVRVHFLQEPIASLVPFFAKNSQNGSRASYTVAAFDLGGGTTDVTVVRVKHETAAGVLEIRPEIIASWGERFGGETLTDLLVEELKRRCREALEKERPGYRLAERAVAGSSTQGIRRNESALREAAEAFKASLSDEREAVTGSDRLVLTLVPDALDRVPEEHPLSIAALRGAGNDLEQTFTRYLRDEVGRIADRLQETVRGLPLDVVHLSGMTALLPSVGGLLRERFGGSHIERAAEPKECVVRGACLWRALSRGRRRRLVLPEGAQRTTSQVGLVDEDDRFVPLIPLDRPIPSAGLTVTEPGGWDGETPVVLWENLGVDNRRLGGNGAANPSLGVLGVWEAPPAPATSRGQWSLHLTLRPDFSLLVTASSAGTVVDLVARSTS